MKKSKLFGSRLVENIFLPRTPKVIMLANNDDVRSQHFEEGDILDANSIKKTILNLGSSLQPTTPTPQVYDASPNGEYTNLEDAVSKMYKDQNNDKCRIITFVDSNSLERYVYYNSTPSKETSTYFWLKILSFKDIQEISKPKILPFKRVVHDVDVIMMSGSGDSIMYDDVRMVFVDNDNGGYCGSFTGGSNYGTTSDFGVTPVVGKIYYDESNGDIYAWCDNHLMKLSDDYTKVFDSIVRIQENEIDAILN